MHTLSCLKVNPLRLLLISPALTTSRRIGSPAPSLAKIRLRRTMSSPAVQAAQAALTSIDLSNYDAEQSRLMDEKCILVDEQDNAIGALDKKTCECPPILLSVIIIHTQYRSLDGKHQQGLTSPSILRLYLSSLGRKAVAPATRFRENNFPGYVDEHLLFTPSGRLRNRKGGIGTIGCQSRCIQETGA